MGKELIGALLILLGLTLLALGLFFTLSPQKEETNFEFSGVVFLGPIPIPFGNFPLSLALVISLIIVIFYILFFIYK